MLSAILKTAKAYAVLQEQEENLITKHDEEGFPSEEALDIAFGKEIIEKDMTISLASIPFSFLKRRFLSLIIPVVKTCPEWQIL